MEALTIRVAIPRCTLGGTRYNVQTALQLRVRPDSYRVGPETVGARARGVTIDTTFGQDELEWYTKETSAIFIIGVLIKVEPL